MIGESGGPSTQGTVRLATAGDVSSVATLHAIAIDEGFLSSLAGQVLQRLYARIVASPHGFLLVADSAESMEGHESGLAGFVAGSDAIGHLYREFLLRDGLSVVRSSAPVLLRSLPRVLETLRYGTRGEAHRGGPDPAIRPRGSETELLALAVDDAERRRGVGASLVEAFIRTSRGAGSSSARVVVGATNHRAIALYGRAGFRESTKLQLHSGADSLVMRVGLQATSP
jgi:ribosomal protein S18 acetylase RimI-like enzyme